MDDRGYFLIWLFVSLIVISRVCLRDVGLLSTWRGCRSCGKRLSLFERFLRDDGFCSSRCFDLEVEAFNRLALERLQPGSTSSPFDPSYSSLPFEGARCILQDRERPLRRPVLYSVTLDDQNMREVFESERRLQTQIEPWLVRYRQQAQGRIQ